MLKDLDQIPWKDLTHAYGFAEDVPDFLRALKTASTDLRDEDSPLWHLYGNIWHQGTVYQATAYAIPFLIEVAEDYQTIDRSGVLTLLAAIATSLMKEEESPWVIIAKDALASGFARIVKLTEKSSEVSLAATHFLAQLPSHSAQTANVICKMLLKEKRN